MTRSGFSASSSSAVLPLGASSDLVALRAEPHAQQLADRRLVVDDQDAERRARSCGGIQLLGSPPESAA